MKFTDMELSSELLHGLENLGFENPTEIQQKAIPYLLEHSRDLIALAQTGTGKTAAYGIPVLNLIQQNASPKAGKKASKYPYSLILSPTRELCVQISNDLKNMAKFIPSINIVAVYGGASIAGQLRELERGAQIIVATPGRMLDIMRRKKANLSHVQMLVLDEADEMLNMGFLDDINAILEETPDEKQTLLFSATMPPEIAQISMNYMLDPYEITIGMRNEGAKNVHHVYYMCQAKDRYLTLKRVVDINPDIYGIVFCRTRAETKEIADALMQDGYSADALHGDLSQSQRDYVMNRFRKRNIQVLVATDVAARGIDVSELTHVINYNLPEELETYTHRSGRTGRAGKEGISVSIINLREKSKIKRLERLIQKDFEYKEIPSGEEICKKQLFYLIDRMEKVEVDEEQIAPFMDVVYKKLAWLNKEDLIKHFVSLEFNRFLSYYQDAKDLNLEQNNAPSSLNKKREKRTASNRTNRFFINVGKRDRLRPQDLLALINKQTGNRTIGIGGIEILDSFSFFETDKDFAEVIMSAFEDAKYKGRNIHVEPAQPERGKGREQGRRNVRKKRQRSGRN